MQKIITFLGRNARPTNYSFNNQVYCGNVFAEALRQFVPHDRMLVCLTDEARQDAWPVLEKLNDPRIIQIPIPLGENTAQMWDMFDAILAHVEDGDSIVFDITHGLRSLPFLVFIFSAYLKFARKVTIEAIYYGALELGNQNAGIPAPVIDLSEFVVMLDWLTATDQFTQTGDARRLAQLLNPLNKTEGAAYKASAALSEVSLSAFLCQPFKLSPKVAEMEQALLKAQGELDVEAKPFGVLRDQICRAFNNFGAGENTDLRTTLITQYRLVEWYLKNNQLIQAMTLAREWLINAVAYKLGLTLDLRSKSRRQMEQAVTGVARLNREFLDDEGQPYIFDYGDLNEYGRRIHHELPEYQEIADLSNALGSVRNALDHAGHQAGAMQVSKIVKKAKDDVMPRLRTLAQKWDLIETVGEN